jgi:hypothetical protein
MLPARSPRFCRPRARPRRTGAAALLLAALLLAGTAGAQSAPKAEAVRGRVMGTIQGAPEGVNLAGTRVVLVQFRISDEGQPKGQPIRSETVGADGKYAFTDVPIEPRTVYQVGATVGSQVVGSQPFTFPAGEREVLLDLHYPRLVTDSSAVRIEQGLIAVEPRRGALLVTEVLHLINPGENVIEGVQRPLELSLPAAADKLEFLREIEESNGHERLGGKLLIYGNLEPGRTTVAFRYRLPVWLGSVELSKQYPHGVARLSVLSPEGSLRLHDERFTPQGTQTLGDAQYDSWVATDIPARQRISVHLSGVPVRQEIYLIPTAGFAVLMAGVVVWFLRRRLRGASTSA